MTTYTNLPGASVEPSSTLSLVYNDSIPLADSFDVEGTTLVVVFCVLACFLKIFLDDFIEYGRSSASVGWLRHLLGKNP